MSKIISMKGNFVFKNRIAVAGWIIMAFILSILCLFTYLFFRDGGLPGTGQWGQFIILLFWIFTLAATAFVYSKPIIIFKYENFKLNYIEYFLWKKQVTELTLNDIKISEIEEGRDSEGDQYFTCHIILADGKKLHLIEGHSRDYVEEEKNK